MPAKSPYVEKKTPFGRRRFLTFVGRELVNNNLVVATAKGGSFGCDWPYVLEDGYHVFYVNISSHLVIQDFDEVLNEKELPKQIQEWFEQSGRKQLGAHLFSTRLGKVQMVYTSIHPSTNDITTSEAHDINSIYPTIRNEEEKGVQRLVLGLFYGTCDKRK